MSARRRDKRFAFECGWYRAAATGIRLSLGWLKEDHASEKSIRGIGVFEEQPCGQHASQACCWRRPRMCIPFKLLIKSRSDTINHDFLSHHLEQLVLLSRSMLAHASTNNLFADILTALNPFDYRRRIDWSQGTTAERFFCSRLPHTVIARHHIHLPVVGPNLNVPSRSISGKLPPVSHLWPCAHNDVSVHMQLPRLCLPTDRTV